MTLKGSSSEQPGSEDVLEWKFEAARTRSEAISEYGEDDVAHHLCADEKEESEAKRLGGPEVMG